MQAGFGIWMDNDWNTHGWNPANFSQNYFQPEGFSESVRLALRLSDEYVWIYTEKPRWWTNEKLPPAYVQALEAAQEFSRGSESLSVNRRRVDRGVSCPW